ncbi:MAG: hypothetical protein KME64_38690 [Scytonematopsis contorta HA4267-MV1]|jgi:hypothetical protein|nr:hypothetical protein [Scytonematopsis contorta HA4267-MV1]
MITEDLLAKEFIRVVEHYYPQVGELLQGCYVKVITSYWGRPPKRLQYIGIYCPDWMLSGIQSNKDALTEVAENMGLAQVVCLNATRLLRDPCSKLSDTDPRLWLDLQWLAT